MIFKIAYGFMIGILRLLRILKLVGALGVYLENSKFCGKILELGQIPGGRPSGGVQWLQHQIDIG